jgi:hypothetical protein
MNYGWTAVGAVRGGSELAAERLLPASNWKHVTGAGGRMLVARHHPGRDAAEADAEMLEGLPVVEHAVVREGPPPREARR